jgi:hypothetical protein
MVAVKSEEYSYSSNEGFFDSPSSPQLTNIDIMSKQANERADKGEIFLKRIVRLKFID